MLSSNNREELFRKQEPKKQRFAIKKLTVGVASVLIGFTFMGLNASASADDTPAQATDDNGNDNAQSQAATGLQSANVALTNQAGTQVNSAAAKAPVNVAPAMPVADAYQKAVAANVAAQATNANSNSPESANTTADKQASEAKSAETSNFTPANFAATPTADQLGAKLAQTTTAIQQSGIEIPNSEWIGTTSSKYNTLNMQTDVLKSDSTATALPFKVTSRIWGGDISGQKNYELRIKLDQRLAPYVKGVKVSQQGDVQAKDLSQKELAQQADGSWSVNLIKLYGGVMGQANVDYAYSNPDCVIEFNDQIENFYNKLSDLNANPLQYAIYGYDKATNKTIGAYHSTGYIVNSGSKFDQPVATGENAHRPATNQPYYQSAALTLQYDKATNTINAFYNPNMLGVWTWDTLFGSPRINRLNYSVDPRLVPYISSVTLSNLEAGNKTVLFNDNGTPKTTNKVLNTTPLHIGAAGTSQAGEGAVEVTAKNMSISVLPRNNHLVEISYKLNRGLGEVINSLGLSSKENNRLQFGAYFTAKNGQMAPNTLATNAYDIDKIAQSGVYQPAYQALTLKQGESGTSAISWLNDKLPTGEKFASTPLPGFTTAFDTNGNLTVTAAETVKAGPYNIPVTVTYADDTVDHVTAPVFVTDGSETVTWGDNGAVVVTANTALGAHETSDHSQVFSPADAVSGIQKYAIDKTTGKIATTGTAIAKDANGVKISWTTTPNTVVETATVAGKTTNGVLAIALGNNADDVLGTAAKTVAANVDNIDAKGAGAKFVGVPVDVNHYLALSADQFKALVDNRIPADEISKTAWKTMPEKGHDAIIEITFNDSYAQGKPTYLDITIPAENINVISDNEANTPQTKPISTPQGVVPAASSAISNQDKLPQGTSYEWTNPSAVKNDVDKHPGVRTELITVTYPDHTTDTVATEVTVDATPTTSPITTWVDLLPDAATGIDNLEKKGVPGYPVSAEWKVAPDISKLGITSGEVTVHYPDGTTQTATVKVIVTDDKGESINSHIESIVSHKTAEQNLIGNPVINQIRVGYYKGQRDFSKPFIYTLKGDHYELTQEGEVPIGKTVNAIKSFPASAISVAWAAKGDTGINIPGVQGNGQPTTVASADNGGTATIIYDQDHNPQGEGRVQYPKYLVTVDASKVELPIFGKDTTVMYDYPSVTIYGATASDKKASVYTNAKDVKAALGDPSAYVNTTDLDNHHFTPSAIEWKTLPDISKADANAKASIELHFNDGTHLDIPVTVNVIGVDDGNTDKTNHDVYRDITRTINVQGVKEPVVQHVIYSRAKLTDLSKPAGQQVTYTDWKAAVDQNGQQVTAFPAVEVTKPGYTATATGATIQNQGDKQFVPASATISPDATDEVVNVTYTANEHTLTITYVDKDTGKQVGTAYTVSGKTGEAETLDVAGHVPANWQLVAGQQVLSTYQFGSTDPAPVSYKVEHKTESVPVDKNNKDTYREVVQTIIETVPGSQPQTVRKTTVPFQRTGVKDLVTNHITWNAWQGPAGSVDGTYTIASFEFKGIKGYDTQINGQKAAKNEIAAVTVNANSQDITDNITFVKQGSTPVPFDPANDNMFKTVTRTITVNDPNGAYDEVQTVKFSREDKDGNAGYTDPVTGETAWNAWHVAGSTETNGSWAEYTAPAIKGYTANPAKVAQVTVTPDTKDAKAAIDYTKNSDTPVPFDPTNDDMYREVTRTITVTAPSGTYDKTQTVKFSREDKDGNAGYTDPVTGKTTMNAWHVAGSESTTGSWAEFTAPTIKGYTANPAKVAEVTVTPDTKNAKVTIDYKKDNDTPVPFDQNDKAMNKDVTRTITVNDPNGAYTKTQTVHFTNEDAQGNGGYADPVTGEIHYNTAWHVAGDLNASEGSWAEFAAPTIKGYTANPAKVAQVTVTADTKDATVTIDYTKNSDTPVPFDPTNDDMYREVTRTITVNAPSGAYDKTQTVKFSREDAQGNAGYTDPVTGKTTMNAWHVAGSESTTGTWSEYDAPAVKGYTANPAKVAEVTVTPDTKSTTVTINYTKNSDTPVPFDPTNDNMYREITRTITINKPGQTVGDTETQTVKFTREDAQGNAGYTDPVTGETSWNAWHVAGSDSATGSWSEYDAPAVKGYTADPTKVAQVTVTPDTKSMTVTINYKKNSDTPVPFDPTNNDMYREVTRTITVNDPSGAYDKTQTVKFSREDAKGNAGYTDPVTGKTTMNAWHVADSESTTGTWPEYDAPAVDGYTADPAKIAAVTVTPDTQSTTVAINYTKNAPQQSDADKYAPSYPEVVTTPGTTQSIDVQYSGDKPAGDVTYEIATGANVPSWVSVDQQTGKITYTVPADATTQVVNVPVTVTYVDGSQDKTTSVAVIVAGKDHVDTPAGPTDVIKNPENLPTGTTVVWTPGEQPDPSKKGDQPTSVTVTVPGHDPITIPTTVNYGNPTDADKYTPEGQDVTTKEGQVPVAADGIKNKGDLPGDTKYTWSNPAQVGEDVKTPGSHAATIVVTYPDGSKDTVDVHIIVTPTDADKYTPKPQPITTPEGQVPNPADGIKNKDDLPGDTKYTWANPDQVAGDVKTPGDHPETIVVTYPDGTTDTVEVPVTVTPTDADKYTPEGQDVTTEEGNLPVASQGIANMGDLPTGTTASWTDTAKVTNDVQSRGSYTETITVTYPDGSTDTVTVHLTVTAKPVNPKPAEPDADKYTPEGQDVTTKEGQVPAAADGIKNKGDLPADTKYTWSNPAQVGEDVKTPGSHAATIVVTYPDGSTDTVDVHIIVTPTDAEKYTPEPHPITTPEGQVPNPADGIKNKDDLPDGTKYTWSDPAQVGEDVKTPGDHPETIVVTYPDGSSEEVTTTVTVPGPEGQDITTPQGVLPDPGDAIKNKDQLPDDTKYTWKEEPDVSTPGDHTGVVEVRFPDGTTVDVPVTVHVEAPATGNEDNNKPVTPVTPHAASQTTATVAPAKVATPAAPKTDNGQPATKKLPQTGNDTSKVSAIIGLGLASFASLFGFGGLKKQKEDK
ncbi:Rib/alpha-like domain-containing protein [Limosilactobacillus caccae]|uniref:Rib/alpha-like domain-containing protein n=1 Tax=Limosilactobacillus caccae TaxID=1926284 RepID=UPI00097037F2|nr:Rib/alpha-like domain-containing protein [Limosilactobacillus caccae]